MALSISRYTCFIPLGLLIVFRVTVYGLTKRDAAKHRSVLQADAKEGYGRFREVLEEHATDSSELKQEGGSGGTLIVQLADPSSPLLSVSLEELNQNDWGLQHLYELYCQLYETIDVENATMCIDVNNCICALVNRAMAEFVTADGFGSALESPTQVVQVSKMLLGDYNIKKLTQFGSNNHCYCVYSVDRTLFGECKRKQQINNSAVMGFVLLAKSILSSGSWEQPLQLLTLCICSSAVISGYFNNSPEDLCRTDLMELQSKLPQGSTLLSFAKRALTGANAEMVAVSVIVNMLLAIPDAVRDFILDTVLESCRQTLGAEVIMTLSRQDYTAQRNWGLSSRVLDLLYTATNYRMDEFELFVYSSIRQIRLATTLVLFPAEIATAWLCNMFVAHTSDSYTDMAKRASFGNGLENAQKKTSAQSHADTNGSVDTSSHGQYGLTLLLSLPTGTIPPALTCVAGHIVLSYYPRPCVTMAVAVCNLIERSSDNEDLVLRMTHQRAALEGLPADGDSSNRFAAKLFSTHIDALRLSGWEGDMSADHFPLLLNKKRNRNDKNTQLGKTFLRECSFVPCITAMAMSSFSNNNTTQIQGADNGVITAAEIMEAGSFVPQHRFFVEGSSNPYAGAIEEDTFADAESYAGSMILLNKFIHKNPDIDCLPWSESKRITGSVSIDFINVSFSYPGSHTDVLKNVSFSIKSGGFLGIIGFSGAGKTTILLLISRIYAPRSGTILINGSPIELFSARELRRCIANCWQEDDSMRFLGNVSLAANVALGNLLDADDALVQRALASSQCTDFVEKRGRGRFEHLNPSAFSGGEMERLVIARSMTKRQASVAVYMFDESTSALDSVTEKQIFDALFACRSAGSDELSTTLIMTTHRLSSIQRADHIIVLADGEIVEQGTWDDLVSNTGNTNFHQLYRSQVMGERKQ